MIIEQDRNSDIDNVQINITADEFLKMKDLIHFSVWVGRCKDSWAKSIDEAKVVPYNELGDR